MAAYLKRPAREELLAMHEEANGELSPEDVIARAQSQNSALHAHFIWDDTQAAHAHRVYVATTLIRRVIVRPVHRPPETIAPIKVTAASVAPPAPKPVVSDDRPIPSTGREFFFRDLEAVLTRYENAQEPTVRDLSSRIRIMLRDRRAELARAEKTSAAPAKRRCLSCGFEFNSKHKGNRMCDRCTGRDKKAIPRD